MELLRYRTISGRIPFNEWQSELEDGAAARIQKRLERLKLGSYGDYHWVGEGVWELIIDAGPGYRVYFLSDGATIVILLCGGIKRTQDGDIRRAQAYAADYWSRR